MSMRSRPRRNGLDDCRRFRVVRDEIQVPPDGVFHSVGWHRGDGKPDGEADFWE
jgi:hypothetical protein